MGESSSTDVSINTSLKTNIVLIVNHAWPRSFSSEINNQKPIRKKEQNLLNKALFATDEKIIATQASEEEMSKKNMGMCFALDVKLKNRSCFFE